LPLRPSPGLAAAEPGGPPSSVPGAGQDAAPAGLDARYEHLRHAVLHDRARAFPLGLGVLVAKGVTAWQRLLTHLTGTPTGACTGTGTGTGASDQTRSPQAGPAAPAQAPLPQEVSTQLIHALAGLAVALTGT
jgi:hypothetical protein